MPRKNPAYTPAEAAWLHAHYATAERAAVEAAVPGRRWSAIRHYAHKIGAPSRAAFRAHITAWTPANLALLHALYPAQGPAAVAARTGLGVQAVRMQAARCQLRYTGAPAPAAPLLAVKRSAATPQLNVQKEARRQKEEAPRRAAAITADEFRARRVPPYSSEWWAYINGGAAGWLAWHQQQSAA